MEMYLQFGYGMMEHCRHLIGSWGDGCVILSPRDLTEEQLERISKDIIRINGKTLLDPQLYNPRANHHRLTQHDFWPEEYSTNILNGGGALDQILSKLKELNDKSCTEKYILPGIICEHVNDDWLAVQENIINACSRILSDKPQIATLCLSADSMRNEVEIETLLNHSEGWDVSGFYVVAEHTRYLEEDPLWLSNLLLLCSGLKLQNKDVIVGYCSHQMLCLASANVDAIASGTWLNVRAFNRARFSESDDDSISRRTKWFYCPQALSEFKIPFLDMAHRNNILSDMRPVADCGTYADILFSGAEPSTTDYTEQYSFRHYLSSLRYQVMEARRDTFSETVNEHNRLLDSAESLLRRLHQFGVRGQDRDYANIIDINRAATQTLSNARGFVLNRTWE